ncbi:MAG: glycosyltransferase family 1 protein [Candidatus Schekmanbacteria bacterium]|nr:MAG: glycosyltransferase family 1 protein [Candidatus Schekmanbacteria bacterium]
MSVSDRKITVVHIITKLELGGAQQNTLYTVEHLDRGKFNVVLITASEGYLLNRALKIKNLDLYLIDELQREINPIKDYGAFKKIQKILKFKSESIGKQNMIIHTHSSKAGILGRWAAYLSGIAHIIHTFHGFGFNDYQPFITKKFYIFLERITAKITSKFIVVSNSNREKAIRLGIGDNDKFHLIRSGIRIEDYSRNVLSREEARNFFSLEKNAPIIGAISCFKPQKDLITFVRAAKKISDEIPEARFIVAGDGDMRNAIEEEIKKLSLEKKFTLLGWTENTSALLCAIDVLLHTALWEGLPRVLVEAAASGVPIVATNIDGNCEIVKDGTNGFLVSPRDYEDMAKKVCRILKDKELHKRLSQNQNSIDKTFHIDEMVKMQEELYLSIMNHY